MNYFSGPLTSTNGRSKNHLTDLPATLCTAQVCQWLLSVSGGGRRFAVRYLASSIPARPELRLEGEET